MVIGATNEIEARQTCRALDPGVLFPFDKAEPPQKLNRIQRKAMREQQPTYRPLSALLRVGPKKPVLGA
jgi:hypothetical protein